MLRAFIFLILTIQTAVADSCVCAECTELEAECVETCCPNGEIDGERSNCRAIFDCSEMFGCGMVDHCVCSYSTHPVGVEDIYGDDYGEM
jgi:hypothetical protein